MGSDMELYEGLAEFRHALRRFLVASEAVSRRAGVTPQQYQALLAVKAWPGGSMTIRDLADQLLLTHQAAVQMVDRLERANLAVRAPSPDDRRSVLVRLTPGGERCLGEIIEAHREAISDIASDLSGSLERVLRLGRKTSGAVAPDQRRPIE